MKLYAVADVHLGNHQRHGGAVHAGLNLRCRQGLAVYRRALTEAFADGDVFVVIGDLLDTDRPPAQLLAAVQREHKAVAGMTTLLVVGNHEQGSLAKGDHALGPLAPYARIIEAPGIVKLDGLDLVVMPFRPGCAETWFRAELDRVMKDAEDAPRVMVLHFGLRDQETAPWLRNAHDALDVGPLAKACAAHGIRAVLAGNWHDRRQWRFPGLDVLQLGALVPTGWDNPGFDGYGTLACFDSDTGALTFRELPGPRFVKLTSEEALAEATARADREGHALYAEVTVGRESLGDVARAAQARVEDGEVAAAEVFVDPGEARAEARTAAMAARNAGNLDEALAAYVGEMPLDEGVNRDRVLARSREYLTRTEAA